MSDHENAPSLGKITDLRELTCPECYATEAERCPRCVEMEKARLAGSRPTAPAPGRRQTLVEETRAKFQRGFMPSEAEVENLFHSYDDKLHAIGLLHGSRTAPEPSEVTQVFAKSLRAALGGSRTAPEPSLVEQITNTIQYYFDSHSDGEARFLLARVLAERIAALAGPPPAGDPTLDAACDRLISLVGSIAVLDPSKRRVAHMDIEALRAALRGGSSD